MTTAGCIEWIDRYGELSVVAICVVLCLRLAVLEIAARLKGSETENRKGER